MKTIVDILKRLPAPIVINLATLENASDITTICKKNGIKQCAYTFTHLLDTVMKHGETAAGNWDIQDKKNPRFGERMYRQAANIPGWPQKQPRSPAGADMRDICAESFPGIHKDEVTLTIYNMTGYSFTNPIKKRFDTRIVENILVQNSINQSGNLPAGNLVDTNSIITSHNIPNNDVLHNLFISDKI